jgi:glycosyltransferase involved in cell wall biosynthesis
MRILLDMRWMVPGVAGGLEHQARALLGELVALDQQSEYTVLLPAGRRAAFDFRAAPKFNSVYLDSSSGRPGRARDALRRFLRPDASFERFDPEVAYSFQGYIRPDLFRLRHVLNVPDLQHQFHPEFFTARAFEERQRTYSESIRRAGHVCTYTEFTRRTLIERLGADPARTTAVPLAADPIFHPADPAGTEDTLRRYGLRPGSYLFFPAHTWHHKNHKAALKALEILRDRHGSDWMLVCSGGKREAQPEIERLIESRGLAGNVVFLGYCPREVMPALYAGARCLVFPSLFEGFGLPVVEAMASGCPVVSSNVTSLPEVAGDAALLIDPNDPEAIAEAVWRLTGDAGLRASLVERGLERAALFSWRKHALEILRVLRRVRGQAEA